MNRIIMTGLMALMTAAAWAVGTENVQPALVNDTSRGGATT